VTCSDCGSTRMPANVARYGTRCIRCWVRWRQWMALCALPVVLATVGTSLAPTDPDAP
jgi:hypothetical protein